MSAEIPLTGIGSNYLVPRVIMEVLLGQGKAGASVPTRGILVAMPFLSTGTAVANTTYTITSEEDIKTIAGPRSIARNAIARILAAAPQAPITYLAVARTTGGSPAAADCDVTWATAPTGEGVTSVDVGDRTYSYNFTSSDTVTTIAAGIVAYVTADESAPFTAANVAGVMTLTAAEQGVAEGDATTGVHRVRVRITAGVGTTVTAEAVAFGISPATAGTEGSTTAAAQLNTALNTVTNLTDYYIVIKNWDATSLTNLRTHVANKNAPGVGIFCCGFFGFTGTVAAAAALAVAKNSSLLEGICQPNGNQHPGIMAANLAAIAQKRELTQNNFNNYAGDDFLITQCYSAADRPSDTDANTAILGGITLVMSNGKVAYIVKRCTTKSKDATGSTNDLRALEPHRRSVMHEIATVARLEISTQMAGKDFEDDTFLASGEVDPNQVNAVNVIKPSMLRQTLVSILRRYNAPERRIITDIEATIASLLVTRHPTLSGVAQARINIAVVDIAGQARMLFNEIGGR